MEQKNYTTFTLLFVTLVFMIYLTKREKFVKNHNPAAGFELTINEDETENF